MTENSEAKDKKLRQLLSAYREMEAEMARLQKQAGILYQEVLRAVDDKKRARILSYIKSK